LSSKLLADLGRMWRSSPHGSMNIVKMQKYRVPSLLDAQQIFGSSMLAYSLQSFVMPSILSGTKKEGDITWCFGVLCFAAMLASSGKLFFFWKIPQNISVRVSRSVISML